MKTQKSVIFVTKNLKINTWKIKNIVKLEIRVIIQGDIEVLCIAYVIWNIVYLENILQFFIMYLTMIPFYHKRVSRKI